MAVSGSVDFELDVSDYVEEAFERCGLEVRTGYDLKTARRSLNLIVTGKQPSLIFRIQVIKYLVHIHCIV